MQEFNVPLGKSVSFRSNMDPLLLRSEEALQKNKKPNDFMKDGILYCGDCKTPKSVLRATSDGVQHLVGFPCECTRKKEQEAAERELELARIAAESKFKANFMGEDVLANCVFEKWKVLNDASGTPNTGLQLKNRLMSYVNHFDEILRIHRGLYLYGSIGVGKTFAAACIANELSRKHYRCIVTNFNRIVNSVWTREHRQEILDDLNSYDLLVIDDLGTEFDTKFIQSLVYEIIDNRYRMGLPLVITSNISYNSLEKTKSEFLRRAYSRIMEMCHPIEVVGINRRKFLAEEKVARFNKFLDGEM